MPVVTDFHHIDEEQDLDPDSHQSESSNLPPHHSEKVDLDEEIQQSDADLQHCYQQAMWTEFFKCKQ
jgi:hypothetical protein